MKTQILHLSVCIIGLSLMGCGDNNASDQNQDSINQESVVETKELGEVEIHNIQNDSGDVIGTYGIAESNGATLTNDNLVAFYKEAVQDSEHEWVTLKHLAQTGIVFSKNENVFTYGNIDQDGTILYLKGEGVIGEGVVESYTPEDLGEKIVYFSKQVTGTEPTSYAIDPYGIDPDGVLQINLEIPKEVEKATIKDYISEKFLMITEKLLEADEIDDYNTICMVFSSPGKDTENIIKMPLDSFNTAEVTVANLESLATDFYIQ